MSKLVHQSDPYRLLPAIEERCAQPWNSREQMDLRTEEHNQHRSGVHPRLQVNVAYDHEDVSRSLGVLRSCVVEAPCQRLAWQD